MGAVYGIFAAFKLLITSVFRLWSQGLAELVRSRFPIWEVQSLVYTGTSHLNDYV